MFVVVTLVFIYFPPRMEVKETLYTLSVAMIRVVMIAHNTNAQLGSLWTSFTSKNGLVLIF
jgi:hypothetical protein